VSFIVVPNGSKMAVINSIRNICTMVVIIVSISASNLPVFFNISRYSRKCLFSENSKYTAGILNEIYKIVR
jgi:hypothetical protein